MDQSDEAAHKADQWYHPRVRWNNPRQTKKSEATWAMALEIKKVWEKLKTEKSDIGGITILRSMNLLDDLSSRVADALCVEFREKPLILQRMMSGRLFIKLIWKIIICPSMCFQTI